MADTDELSLLKSFEKSRGWKWLRLYLEDRRLALFNESVQTTTQLWRNKGAIEELSRLLKAPHAVLSFYEAQHRSNGHAVPSDLDESPPSVMRGMFPDDDL